MKKFTFICTVLAISFTVSAQTWHWINPTTGLQGINGIGFVSPDEGVAVGDRGAILHYKNGEWSIAESPVGANLNAVEFINPVLAWAVGDSGTILRYDGNDWVEVDSPITGCLKDIFCVDENHCWAVGSAILFYDGTSWQVQAEISGLDAVGFISANEGWAGSSNTHFFHFSNGNWAEDDSFADSNPQFFQCMIKAGEGRLLMNGSDIAGDGVLYENTGQGWQPLNTGSINDDISFFDASHGFGIEHASNMNFDLFPTIKYSNHDVWTTEYTLKKREQLFSSVEALASDEAMAGDVLGYIHHGNESNWDLSNGFICDSILNVDFFAPNKGFIGTHNSGIWKYNAGNWNAIFSIPGFAFNEINFESETYGYATAFETFSYLPPPFNVEVKLFDFRNGVFTEIQPPYGIRFYTPISSINEIDNKLIVSSNNSIWTIENYYWSEALLPESDSISKICFVEPIPIKNPSGVSELVAAWLCAKRGGTETGGVIYYKEYFENDWQQAYQTSSGSFNDLCITDDWQVYAVGTHGLIAHFDGSNWTEIEPLTDEDLLSVSMFEGQNGWAVGKNGTILHCNEGVWSVYNSPATYHLNKVDFYKSNLGFMVGNEGTFLCTDEKLPVGTGDLPVSKSLNQLQIYPNPAKDGFIIEMNSPTTDVQVSIIDPTGRLLSEKDFQITNHSNSILVQFDKIAPGVYLVKAMNGRQIMTGKVMIQ
ncbi:MAG: T9SS type A sorting domain-containing protein [Lentimicrobiaceae bacterium]